MAVVSALHLWLLLNVVGNWGLSPERRISSAPRPPRAWDNDIPSAAQTHAGHTTSGSSAAGETDMHKSHCTSSQCPEICICMPVQYVLCWVEFWISHQTWNQGWPMALPTLNLRLTTTCSRLLIRFTAERQREMS